ncbi:MAG: MGMT family protein [Planctomycetota bacterium]
MSGWGELYAAVMLVPAGQVATYGQIARAAGLPRHARQVGYALAALEADSPVPWHRVVNARGAISLRAGAERQRAMLEAEGVRFDESGRVDLKRYGWDEA